MIQKFSDYLKKHEGMLVSIGVLVLVLFLGNKWLDHRVDIANSENSKALAALAEQKKVVDQLAGALQSAQKNSDLVVQQSAAQVATLEQEISILRSGLMTQQAALKTKPLPEVALTWEHTINLPDSVHSTEAGLIVSEAAARETVSQLISVPVLEKTISDQEFEINSKNSAIAAQSATIKAGEELVTGLKVQIVDSRTSFDKQLSLEKAKANKGRRTWFLIGFASGVATRILAHF